MKIDKVTITGADDSTDVDWMIETSKKFPFVEWGLLVLTHGGSPRFPSNEWLHTLRVGSGYSDTFMALSLHVCGKWVRDICAGDWGPLMDAHGKTIQHCNRIQLNFHNYKYKFGQLFFASMGIIGSRQLIFQIDAVNTDLAAMARTGNIDAVPLFDMSGGAGVVPESWPVQEPGVYSGYAGGLGADNILTEIKKIDQVAGNDSTIWIDMETRVRTLDNKELDQSAVESVLEQVENSGYLQAGHK